jgi:dihydroflavonol-4-reductase
MAGTVLVTGGSGYIGGELVRQLLARDWTVHTTIRDLKKEPALRAAIGDSGGRLRVFKADLTDDAGWAEATAGCSHVAHVASPIPANAPKHDDELIVPARDGVLRALKAARDAGATRFVQTSSAAAIAYGRPTGEHTFTEKDWTILDGPNVYAYVKSKTVAERAARDWVAAEGGQMEFASVNPALVLGPVTSADFSTSVEVIRQLLAGAMPGSPNLGFGVVDVRDVADLHVRVLEAPGMAGERFIASGPFMKMAEVAAVLKAELGDKARKVPTRTLPNWAVRIASLFNPPVRQFIGELDNVRHMDASHAREVLGWQARPARETIVECAESLIEHGIVKV